MYPPQGTKANLADLEVEIHHVSYVFPEDTDETVTFAAGGTENEFGSWAEIKDNNNVALSSKATSKDLYISSLAIEEVSVQDKRVLVEIGHGDGTVEGTTIIGSHRFAAPLTKFVDIVQQIRVRPLKIPAGETIYYRMKCETAEATCNISIRYHYHD